MSKYNKEWLIEKYQQKEKVKFLFFWGHQSARDGDITQSCLSQWWPAPFEHEEKSYLTAEHWMMAKKAELFQDKENEARVLNARSPMEAKKIGRLIQNFVPDLWDKHKYDIVMEGNYLKFSQHAPLKDFLLQTGERILVEASPVDPVWGIGLAADNGKCENPLLWQGENLLGFALMEVRDRLKTNL